jgi:hypothetical protein
MRYFYDTEFLEEGKTIELISIGIVAEDGREYYAVNRDAPWKRIAKNDWLVSNVVRQLPRIYGDQRFHVGRHNPLALDFDDRAMKTRDDIANEVRDFLLAVGNPELWAWYAAYDHVVLCQLWGSMIHLPEGIPMYTHDLKQECDRLGNPEMPAQPSGEHNALADAQHVRAMAEYLAGMS